MTQVFKISKRITIFLFILCFSFVLVFTCSKPKVVKAEPVTIAVSAIAALVSFLAASGVAVTSQGMNQGSLVDTYSNLANEYAESSNVISLEDAAKSKDAINYYYNSKVGDAVVSLNETMTNWFNGFKSWFVTNFALTDSGETVIISEDKLNFLSGSYPYYPSSSVFIDGKVPISAFPIIPDSTQVITIDNRYSLNVLFGEPYDYYGHRMRVEIKLFDNATQVGSFTHIYASGADQSFEFIKIYFSQYNGSLAVRMAPDDWGGYTVDNYGFTIPLSISSLDMESIGLTGSLTDGYDDFSQALEDAKTEAGTNGQIAVNTGEVAVEKPYTQEGIINGILDNALTNVGTGTLVGGYADEKEVEEENDMEKVPTYAEIGEGLVIVDGLEDFFPFCIPWDIYAFIEKFDAPAEAPNFDIALSFPGVRDDPVPLHLDLSDWEVAARIFRILMLIGFGLFLVFKTRDLIRG